MAQRKKKTFRPAWRYIIFGAVILVGLGLGLLATYMAGWQLGRKSAFTSALATQAAVEQAKEDITTTYLATSIKDCVDPTTGQAYDGKAYFEKYLKVNAYANRAVIRACNTNGELLAKIDGKWVGTAVNLNLSARANPTWSTACYANDILTPDTVVRSENRSIDYSNLRLCQGLQHNQNLRPQDL